MVGTALADIRHEHLMSQRELGAAVGVSHTYIALIEKGTRALPFELAVRIANVLDISLYDLVKGESNEHINKSEA